MRTVDLLVPGAHCGVCRGAILKVLLAVPGVHGAEVDLRDRRAIVLVNPAAVEVAELCDHLGRAGYPAVPVPDSDPDPIAPQGVPNPAP